MTSLNIKALENDLWDAADEKLIISSLKYGKDKSIKFRQCFTVSR